MKHKNDTRQSTIKKPGLFPVLSGGVVSLLLFAAAGYALLTAGTLKTAIYEDCSADAAVTSSLIFDVMKADYNDELSSLHRKGDAQGARFDDMTALLTSKARQSGFEQMRTIVRRGAGYVNILDSRFMRGLTPNVDYSTVGSVYRPSDEGGRALEAAVNAVAFDQKPTAYAVVRRENGGAAVISVCTLADRRGEPIGLVLATAATGLVGRADRLAAPVYLFAAFFGVCAVLLLAQSLLRLYRLRKALRDDSPPELLPEDVQNAGEPLPPE